MSNRGLQPSGAVTSASVTSAIGAGSWTGQPYVYDGTQIAPGTYIAWGATVPATGSIRWPYSAPAQPLLTRKTSGGSDANVISMAGDIMTVGSSWTMTITAVGGLSYECQAAVTAQTDLFRVKDWGGGVDRIRVDATNLAFVSNGTGAPNYQSGTLVAFWGNASAVPTGNPTAGGFLYAEAGAGKWRGSGGTVTTFGPAEPHCPRCGRDFALQYENARYGGELSVCVPCLLGELVRLGGSLDRVTIKNEVL